MAALLVLPILAHLARQAPRVRRAFGAMLLIERVVKRLRRRRRVKDPVLLAMRLGALLALLLGLASPFLTVPGGTAEYGATGRVVLVVDRSLSMGLLDSGGTLLQRAREDAQGVLDDLPDGTLVGVISYADDAERLTASLTADRGRAGAQLASIAPSHGASALRAALVEARLLLGGEPGEVVLFTDEAGPRMVGEAETEIGRLVAAGSTVFPRISRGDPARNVAVTTASFGDGVEGGAVTFRAANFGPDALELPCEVTLPDGAKIPVFADVPPGGEAEERITIPREAAGGVGTVWCEDPDLPADDHRYFHLPRVGASRVLVVDGDPGDTPIRSEIYFLERALAPWGGVRTGVTIDVTTPVGLLELDPEVHRVVFLANVADPRPFGPRLTEFVRGGGNLVISGGDNVTADRYNAAFDAILPASIRKASAVAAPGELGIAVALPDQGAPMFAPFTRSGRSGFSRVRSHTVLTFDPFEDSESVSVLLRYDNGLPALVERTIGSGRVVVWTGTFDLGWGNLPLQAVFMPMVQRLVGYLGAEAGGRVTRLDGVVGFPVVVQLPGSSLEPQVLGPDGEPVRSRLDGSRLLFVPRTPGAYQVGLPDAPPSVWVAVNVDPDESDVRTYGSVAAVERALDPKLLTRNVELGRPLLGFGLVMLLGAAALATREPS
jgi:hypothetical protein